MNLFWLKYVSWAFLAGAAFFYFVIRLNRTGLSRGARIGLYVACIVMACVTWWARESNAQHHSPRKLVMGTVAQVSAVRHRAGGIWDEFQLRLDGGSLSPEFSTDVVANGAADQPIHEGDYLGVFYRTWDDVPLTIDEIEGQKAGWHYSRDYDGGGPYILGVAFAGLIGLIVLVIVSRNQRPRTPASAVDFHLNG